MNNRPSPNKTRQIGFLVLIFVLLLGTIYSMTRNTAKESLVYSEVIELFETKQLLQVFFDLICSSLQLFFFFRSKL